METLSVPVAASEVVLRSVLEEEALSGIGTYIGSALCVARVPRGKPKVWDYDNTNSGVLQVTFVDETCEIPFTAIVLQDLALETYARRPCLMRGTTDIMPAEMRSIHIAVHCHFNGIRQSARRSSVTILRKLGMNPVEESQVIPFFNLARTQVQYLQIEHILNYVFYEEGKRRAPQGVSVPSSLFADISDVPLAPDHRGMDAERLGQWDESDEDLVEEVNNTGVEEERPERNKRSREVVLPAWGESRLLALRRRLVDDLISSLMVTAGMESKSQFKPSRQQSVAHGAMVNGKYASFDQAFR
ncbi:Hypothetical protein PHPALM_5916 [Phytophthora palmivora]|uniref:Uncharacterized protein n=1 Tax=Phytophthora palmivora TaxID=4796 RepID=A0A2P4YG61_9STRA|nr:Hypothetical protein PHPALM_5916 [Phytophthora palmivora]